MTYKTFITAVCAANIAYAILAGLQGNYWSLAFNGAVAILLIKTIGLEK